jgi:uncharacterized membrane protein YeaQ/YmgE (transglycosylase-associated protein family)
MVVNILAWCLFGLIAGALAQFLMPGKDPGGSGDLRGMIVTILLGIAGAFVGGYLSSHLFNWDVSGFSVESFAVAVGGALVLLILYRVLMTPRRMA